MKPRHALAAILAFTFSSVGASTLETTHYRVSVIENCAEGDVNCADVTYVGTSKISGRSIRLGGRSVAHICADGVTPCRKLGYEFDNGRYRYFVGTDGSLIVTRKGKLILSELGRWE